MKTFDLENADIDKDENDPFNEYLSNVSYAIRSAYHQTHGYSPAQMVFGRDMFLDTKVDINWEEIKIRKQERIHRSNVRENEKRIDHTYSQGDLILLKRPGILRTLTLPFAGPYKVVRHNRNGSITIEKAPNDIEKVNIRQVHPYFSANDVEN